MAEKLPRHIEALTLRLSVELNGIRFPLEYCFRHLLVVGQPGAGKTRCVLMPLLRSILERTGSAPEKKAAMVIFDPKNELGPFIQALAQELGRVDDLIFFRPGSTIYNPLANPFLSEAEIVEKIVLYGENPSRGGGSHSINEAFWGSAQKSLLGAITYASDRPRLVFGSGF